MSRLDNDLCAGINCSECCGCETYGKGYQQGRADAIEQILNIAKCEDEDVECWDCAFGDADIGCRLKQLRGEYDE